MEDVIYDVIIVGSGLAGLSAAQTFLQNGIQNILILEAQSCAGGRVSTIRFKDTCIDLGAQWIHGQKNNSLFKFAAERNLVSSVQSTEGEGAFYSEDGEVVDESLIERVDFAVSKALFHSTLNDVADIDQVLSNAQDKFLLENDASPHLVSGLFQWHRNYHLIDNSCQNLSDLCAKAWLEYEECEGPYCQTVNRGFSSIINNLANNIPEEMILLNSPVIEIDWSLNNSRGVLAKASTPDRTFFSRHFLVTCSAGVLQRCQIFKPNLPLKFRNALNNIGFGTITKIFLIFEKPFWDEDKCKGFQFALNGERGSEKDVWLRYVTGFDVCESGSPAVLVGWVGGTGAEILDNSDIPDNIIGETCVRHLRRLTRNPEIPDPLKTIRTKWLANPYVLGAYSFRKAPFNSLLMNPITVSDENSRHVPVLVFAGEAFHQQHYSTAHGAYESGQQQATKIINWLKRNV